MWILGYVNTGFKEGAFSHGELLVRMKIGPRDIEVGMHKINKLTIFLMIFPI